MVLECPGATKFEQKNHGIAAARGEIVALTDADCAPPALALPLVLLHGAVIGLGGVGALLRLPPPRVS